jgi:hypothetical protein
MIGGKDINVNSRAFGSTQMFFMLYAFVNDVPAREVEAKAKDLRIVLQYNWL